MEDRFLTYQQMVGVSDELAAAGFKHVVAIHRIDPCWRAQYRAQRPELEAVAYTLKLDEYLTPMPKIEQLIGICRRHGLTFWMGGSSGDPDHGSGPELYLKVEQAGSRG